MNDAERRVLRNNKQEIKKHLHFDASILDELDRDDILSENQRDTIEAEKTNEDRIKQLLHILPRRGPKAFTRFLNAIRKNSSFLAEFLEEELKKELNNIAETKQENSSNISPSCEDVSMESLPPANIIPTGNDDATESKETNNVSSMSQAHSVTFDSTLLQQNLNSLYNKLKTHLTNNSMRELSLHSPQPVSFDMIDKLLEDLFTTLDNCYDALGGKARSASLLSSIIDLKLCNKELGNTVKIKEKQRNKYADNIIKLESKCRDKQVQIEKLKIELENLKKKNNSLQKQVHETDTKLKEMEDKVKSMKDEKLEVARSNEVEREELKGKIKKKLCEATATGKKGVRQTEKNIRRDSQGSILNETKKLLQRLQQKNNSKYQPNVNHSQTKLSLKEIGKLQQNNESFQPNRYKLQITPEVKETGKMHRYTQTRYTEQVKRTQLDQPYVALQRNVMKEPTLFKRKPVAARSLGSVNMQIPAISFASQRNSNTRIRDDPKQKFFGALNHINP